MDTQTVLPYGNEAEVEQETIRAIDALGKGGGLILAPVHNVQADVPAENLIRMFEVAREYGRYPLPERNPIPLVELADYSG